MPSKVKKGKDKKNIPTFNIDVDSEPRKEFKPPESITNVPDLLQENEIPIPLPPVWDQSVIDFYDFGTAEQPFTDPEGNPPLPCKSELQVVRWIRAYDYIKQRVIMEAQRTGKPIVESPVQKEDPPSTANTGGKKSKSPSKKPDKKNSISQANEPAEDPFLPFIIASTPECVKLDDLSDYNNNNPANPPLPCYRTLVHPLLVNDACPDTKAVASELECISLYPDKISEPNTYLWEAIYPKDENNYPIYNPSGKYVIKVFISNEWRYIVIDDLIPVDGDDNALLTASSNVREIWPLLLHKAILKIRSLYPPSPNLLDPWIIHSLTSWIPTTITQGEEWWDYLQRSTPFPIPSIPLKTQSEIDADRKAALDPKANKAKQTKAPNKKPNKPKPPAKGKEKAGGGGGGKGKGQTVEIPNNITFELKENESYEEFNNLSTPPYVMLLHCTESDSDRGFVEGRYYGVRRIRISPQKEKQIQVFYPLRYDLDTLVPPSPPLKELDYWIPIAESYEIFNIEVLIFECGNYFKNDVLIKNHWNWNVVNPTPSIENQSICHHLLSDNSYIESNPPYYYPPSMIIIEVPEPEPEVTETNENENINVVEEKKEEEMKSKSPKQSPRNKDNKKSKKNDKKSKKEESKEEEVKEETKEEMKEEEESVEDLGYVPPTLKKYENVLLIFTSDLYEKKYEPCNALLNIREIPNNFDEALTTSVVIKSLNTSTMLSHKLKLSPGRHMLLLECDCSQGYSLSIFTDYIINPSFMYVTRPLELKLQVNNTQGLSPMQNCKEWKIWLRKVIMIKEDEIKMELNLHISHYDVRDYVHIVLINNENVEVTEFPLLRTQPFTLKNNNNRGYTIIIYGYNETNPLPSTPYELSILTDKVLQAKSEDIPMTFTQYFGDYYILNKYYYFEQDLVSLNSGVSDLTMRYLLSDSNLPFIIEIIDGSSEDRKVMKEYKGIGEIIIYQFPYLVSGKEEGFKGPFIIRGRLDEERLNSETIHELESTWPLYHINREKLEEELSNPEAEGSSPAKGKKSKTPTQGKKGGKNAGVMNPEDYIAMPSLEENRLFWIVECESSKGISLKRDTVDDVNRNKDLSKWLEEDPLRFEKGKENRTIYLNNDVNAVPTYLEEEEVDIYRRRQEMKSDLPDIDPLVAVGEVTTIEESNLESMINETKEAMDEENKEYTELLGFAKSEQENGLKTISEKKEEYLKRRQDISNNLENDWLKREEYRKKLLLIEEEKEKESVIREKALKEYEKELKKNAPKKKPPPKKKK